MKKLVPLLVCLITAIGFSQKPIIQDVGEFATLKVYDLINLEMIKSDENKIEIYGKNASDVVVVNKNKTLKIKMELDEMFDGNKTEIKLHYTSVDVIDANEGAYITSGDEIKQFEIDLRAQEGGSITVKVNTTETSVKAVTGGIIATSGTTHNQTIKVNTGGIYHGKDLKSITSELAIRAGGEVEVNASELLDIKITAGGDVYIYGEPKTVNKSKALGGRIKYM